MNKSYSIEKNTIVEVLDEVQNFIRAMTKMNNIVKNVYSYDIKIIEGNQWKAIVTVNRSE